MKKIIQLCSECGHCKSDHRSRNGANLGACRRFAGKCDCPGGRYDEPPPGFGSEPLPPDRKEILLKAAYDLLMKQERSHYVLNLLEQTVFYHDTDCDGRCLMDDIANELNFDR